jgi:hypothetical protein
MQEILNVKAIQVMICAVALVLFSVNGWARDKMKTNIHVDQTVNVGSTQLAPGEYKMTWTEGGRNAEVTFSQGNKVVATIPAEISQQHSGYDSPVVVTDSRSNRLTEVDLPGESFSFTADNPAPVR